MVCIISRSQKNMCVSKWVGSQKASVQLDLFHSNLGTTHCIGCTVQSMAVLSLICTTLESKPLYLLCVCELFDDIHSQSTILAIKAGTLGTPHSPKSML